MANPQRKPDNAQGTKEQFTSGPCGNDPCYQSLADQLNEVLAPIIGSIPGVGSGEDCAVSRIEKLEFANYLAFHLYSTSDSLIASRAFNNLAVSCLPAVSWLNRTADFSPHYLWGVRDLPSSSSGSLQAFAINSGGTPTTASYTALETPLLKGAAQVGPFLSSPDGHWLAVTRKQGGSTAHFMTIDISPPIGEGYGGGPNLPVLAGDLTLPTNPTGPAEGIWLEKTPYVILPTRLTSDMLYVIDVRHPATPVIAATVTASDTDLSSIAAVRVNQDETVMYVAGGGGVSAWNILDPASLTETSSVVTAGRQWDTLHLAEGASSIDGYIFVAERTSATAITTRTIDVDQDDPSAISLNTSKGLTGSFGASTWGTIRAMRGTNVSWYGPHGVGCLSIPSSSPASATVVTFDLSDLTSVSIKKSQTLSGLDSQATYTIANYRSGTSHNRDDIFLQLGLGIAVDTIKPAPGLSSRCKLTIDQLQLSLDRPLPMGDAPIILGPEWARLTIANLNADLLDGLHADAFLQGIGASTTNAVPRWGTAYGEILQDSGVTIDDSDNVTLPDSLLYGSAASGGDLELHSTSHATLGTINLGDTIYVDEVNGRLGVGTSAPSYLLHFKKDVGAVALFAIHNLSTTDGRATIRYEADRSSSYAYEVGIDPQGGSAKAWQVRDLTASGNPIRMSISKQGNVIVGSDSPNTYSSFAGLLVVTLTASPPTGSGSDTFTMYAVDIAGAGTVGSLFRDETGAVTGLGRNTFFVASAIPSWQSMVGGVFLGVATTAPTGDPTSGFFIYMDPADSALKARGPSGTTTTLASA